jgi:hypothetical protein
MLCNDSWTALRRSSLRVSISTNLSNGIGVISVNYSSLEQLRAHTAQAGNAPIFDAVLEPGLSLVRGHQARAILRLSRWSWLVLTAVLNCLYPFAFVYGQFVGCVSCDSSISRVPRTPFQEKLRKIYQMA